jgi:hypothetical protein
VIGAVRAAVELCHNAAAITGTLPTGSASQAVDLLGKLHERAIGACAYVAGLLVVIMTRRSADEAL